MFINKGVHVLNQNLHWNFLDDELTVALIEGILEQQHEEDEDLFETPGLSLY
jgi:hypothetical protein